MSEKLRQIIEHVGNRTKSVLCGVAVENVNSNLPFALTGELCYKMFLYKKKVT